MVGIVCTKVVEDGEKMQQKNRSKLSKKMMTKKIGKDRSMKCIVCNKWMKFGCQTHLVVLYMVTGSFKIGKSSRNMVKKCSKKSEQIK